MKKSITMPKNWKKGPFGVFQHPFCRKAPKFEVGTLWGKFFPLKSIPMPKKPKGGLWSRPVLYVTRKTFLVQFLGPTGTIWRLLKTL